MATMSLQAAYDQARSYLEANQVEQAIGVAQHLLEHFPENLEAYRILGEAYLASRQFDQAETAFGRVLHADPENIPAHVGLGITFERQGKLDRAVTEFEQALEVRPDMPELRGQLLRLYTDLWGAEGATLRLSRPGLARLYAKGHMLPQAIQEFRSVIEEHPDRFDARVGLAEALWRDGQEDAAAETCEAILAERADVLKANLLLGYIRLADGDERGEPHWRLAQQLDPYQQVARSLFESLPDVPAPDLNLPAWDEPAWLERRARDEEQRLAQQPAAAPAAAAAALAATAADEESFSSWLDQVDRADEVALTAPPAPPATANDDFLASLLSLETPPLPADEGSDLDESSGITPFSFDDFDAEPAAAAPLPLEVLGGDDQVPEAARPGPDGDQAPVPFTIDDLGLGDDELAQLDRAVAEQSAGAAVTPLSLDDLGLDAEPPPAGLVGAEADPELQALEPFSLADLGLTPDEVAELNAAQAAEPAGEAADELAGLEPFSLADLGLTADEIAQLEGGELAATVESEAVAPELEPFSLADLGLSPEEIASLEGEAQPPQAPGVPELSNPAMLDWGAGAAEGTEGLFELDGDLGDLQPFSLDDLDLNALGGEDEMSALPPSLRPFSLDDAAASSAPPPSRASEPDEGGETGGGYSWQQPAAKAQTDFVRSDEAEPPQASIFGKLRQQAADRPPEEPPPLPPVSDDDAADAGYFSNDEVSLRDEETGGSERFAGGFRLPKEDAAAGPPLAAVAAAGALAAAAAAGLSKDQEPKEEPPTAPGEPELTPFSLEDLGLSPEEIAQLEAAGQPAAPADTGEPELTPFSLEDLGLSPEEIAQLEAASGDLAIPATGETIVPGWSQGEEPELTPFSLDDIELGPVASAADAGGIDETVGIGVEPFSLDDFDFELGAGGTPGSELDPSVGADVQPFSLDDLGLGESGPADDASRELGVTAEELAGLDLGEFETLLGDLTQTTPLVSDDPEAAFERLVSLGRTQGFVDLTDIMQVVSDPEAEAERIEELGWALHNAGIEIRDGDEVIDMESEGEEAVDESLVAAAPEAAPDLALPASDAEPDLTPFSLSELGLSDEEIAALGLAETTSVGEPASGAEAEPELTPFSLEDLGLSPEEIAQLEGAAAGEPELAAPADEPELTPFSLEDLGLTAEEIAQLEGAAAGEPAAASPAEAATGEPELTPFSLEDLGLSAEEIAQLEGAAAGEPAAASPGEAAAGEPELTPFSLEDLGLSAEEIAQLEGATAAGVVGATAAGAVADSDDPFDFGEVEAQPVEKVTRRSEPRVEEPPPPVDPGDSAFQPEPLDSLDDIWETTPAVQAPAAPDTGSVVQPARAASEADAQRSPAAPARVVLPPLSERKPELPPRTTTGRSGDGERRPISRDDERYARREAAARRSREDERFARRDRRDAALWREAPPEPPAPARAPVQEFAGFLPTGDNILDDYLKQLDSEPDNYGLALAIGRLCAQTGRPAIMALAFKRLVRAGEGIPQLTEELEGLLGTTDDPSVKPQLYRLLGDAYSKQGRYREAMSAYSTTFGR